MSVIKTKLHVCGGDIYKRTQIFYSETTEKWWMGTDHSSCIIIKFCPFCGLELAKGEEEEWPYRQGCFIPPSKGSSQIPF